MTIENCPELSIVIPFYNEEESIEPVCNEVISVLAASPVVRWEILLVNDGSTDRTASLVDQLCDRHPVCRAIHLLQNSGQSAALQAGFLAAEGALICTLDGDGQNDPGDIPRLLQELAQRDVDMICGIRRKRADNIVRRISSRLANRVRALILQDNITDVGCSLRIFRRDLFRKVPFFRNAHRFFPALSQMTGFSVAEVPVNHRPRGQGVSKYGGGINSRLWVGIFDLMGVYWLKRRGLSYQVRSYRNHE